VGKLEGETQVQRPICRWQDNIKIDLREITWGGMDCINLAQDKVGSCAYGNEPSGSIKCSKFLRAE
jgi:hypothetical protein